MLKKCIGDPETVIRFEGLGVQEKLWDEMVPFQILYRKVRGLRNKEVASIMVLWKNHLVKGETWETEANKMSHYALFAI